MKKEMIKYLEETDKDGHPLWMEPRRQWIEEFIDDFFDQYQPERSKREDLKMCKKCKSSYEGESDYLCNCCLKDYEPLKNTIQDAVL